MSHMPERMCVICRLRFPKQELMRYVLLSSGERAQDIRKTLPGRGWYLCTNPRCIERFEKYKMGMIRRKGATK